MNRLSLPVLTCSCAVLVLSAAFVAPAVLCAQEKLSAEQAAIFKQHLQRGAEALKAERWEEAITHFEAARELADHPKIVLNIARAQAKLERCKEAKASYDGLLALAGLEAALRSQAQRERSALEEQCARQPGSLIVRCPIKDTRLWVDEKEQRCDEPLALEPGAHSLHAEARGHVDLEEDFTIQAGEPLQMTLRLSERPAPHLQDSSRLPRDGLLPSDGIDWSGGLQFTLITVGALSLGTAITLEILAAARTSELEQLSTNPQPDRDDRDLAPSYADSARTSRRIIWISALSGVVLTTAGLLWWALEDDEPASSKKAASSGLRLQIAPGAQGAALGWQTRW